MSIGTTLRAARESRGLTIEQVSDQTRLAKALIERLEADDFSSITAVFYGRGFMRLLGEFYEIDTASLIDDFTSAFASKNLHGDSKVHQARGYAGQMPDVEDVKILVGKAEAEREREKEEQRKAREEERRAEAERKAEERRIEEERKAEERRLRDEKRAEEAALKEEQRQQAEAARRAEAERIAQAKKIAAAAAGTPMAFQQPSASPAQGMSLEESAKPSGTGEFHLEPDPVEQTTVFRPQLKCAPSWTDNPEEIDDGEKSGILGNLRKYSKLLMPAAAAVVLLLALVIAVSSVKSHKGSADTAGVVGGEAQPQVDPTPVEVAVVEPAASDDVVQIDRTPDSITKLVVPMPDNYVD